MRSMMIPAQWDTASRTHRTRSSGAARSSFRREQTSADCLRSRSPAPALPSPPPGKAPSLEESAQGRLEIPAVQSWLGCKA